MADKIDKQSIKDYITGLLTVKYGFKKKPVDHREVSDNIVKFLERHKLLRDDE